MFPAMHSNRGRYFAKASASPPAIMVMPGGRPLTGASNTSTLLALHPSATPRKTLGELVVMSI